MDAATELLHRLLEDQVEATSVTVLEKYRLSGIATEDDVVNCTGIMDVWFACHEGRNSRKSVRGRDAGYPAPPAQIPACGTTAPGSCLGSDAEALIWIGMCYARCG